MTSSFVCRKVQQTKKQCRISNITTETVAFPHCFQLLHIGRSCTQFSFSPQLNIQHRQLSLRGWVFSWNDGMLGGLGLRHEPPNVVPWRRQTFLILLKGLMNKTSVASRECFQCFSIMSLFTGVLHRTVWLRDWVILSEEHFLCRILRLYQL